jgi:eukaryotic-like serine/threonine-protein kinase
MPDSDVGSYFGKYFLLKKIAAGGMGEVFLAKQQGPAGFEKILIVKKVLAHLTENKEFVELFLSEARLAARMNHRNIVQVFELGEENGAFFIAMEYVQGKPLREVIDAAIKRKEKIPAELCRSVVEQICDGSSYAHNLTDVTGRCLNIVHRDLNPQNVLVSYTGDVKVIDFGIAKSEMSTVKTEAGMIKGKFVYMSPEQSLAKKLDKRSDIFPIGITLYEMLTGINPFHKNNIVLTLEAVQRYDPPPPSEYDPAYAPFDPIVAKALAKDRDRRYSDAAEMQDDLRRIVVSPSPERLGQFMSRLFRQQLEEEQKILKDTDSAKVTSASSMPKKTPARAAPTPAVESEGSTVMLPKNTGSAKVTGKPPARPAPRPPPPAPKKGPSDTLMDMEAPVMPPADDAPGATLMLKPGVSAPPPPKKRSITDTVPEGELPAPSLDDAPGATQMLKPGTPPPTPPRKRPAPQPDNGVGAGGTNIMTPEEAQAAQREALAKLQANQGAQQPRRPGPRTSQPPPPSRKGKGLWIALGVGAVVVLAAAIGLVMMLLGDDARPVRKPKPAPAAETASPPEEKKAEAPAPPPAEKPAEPAPAAEAAPPPAEAPAPAAPAKKVKKEKPLDAPPPPVAPPQAKAKDQTTKAGGTAPARGTLTLNTGPNVPVTFDGQAFGKTPGTQKVPVSRESGTIEFGDAANQFRVTAEYAVSGSQLSLKFKSDPWAIVSVDQVSKGKTPVGDIKIGDGSVTVEFKKPGQDAGLTLRLGYSAK